MTRQLKDLMHEATDRPAFTPDVGQLLNAGRRQTRNRRLLSVVGTAAAVTVVAGGTMFALGGADRSAPAVTPTLPTPTMPSAGPTQATGRCTDKNGEGIRDRINVRAWPAAVYLQDNWGISSVSPNPRDREIVAYCTTEWGNGAKDSIVPGGEIDGLVLRKTAAIRQGVQEPGSITSVFGVAPKGVQRITVETADGFIGVAKVKAGHFVYRRLGPTPWPGPIPSAVVRFKFAGQAEYVAARR